MLRTGRRIAAYRDTLRIKALDALKWSRFAFNLCSVTPVFDQCICFLRWIPRDAGRPLFRNDFDEDAVRENSATEQVNASVPGKAAQHGWAGRSWNGAFVGFLSAAAG